MTLKIAEDAVFHCVRVRRGEWVLRPVVFVSVAALLREGEAKGERRHEAHARHGG